MKPQVVEVPYEEGPVVKADAVSRQACPLGSNRRQGRRAEPGVAEGPVGRGRKVARPGSWVGDRSLPAVSYRPTASRLTAAQL